MNPTMSGFVRPPRSKSTTACWQLAMAVSMRSRVALHANRAGTAVSAKVSRHRELHAGNLGARDRGFGNDGIPGLVRLVLGNRAVLAYYDEAPHTPSAISLPPAPAPRAGRQRRLVQDLLQVADRRWRSITIKTGDASTT